MTARSLAIVVIVGLMGCGISKEKYATLENQTKTCQGQLDATKGHLESATAAKKNCEDSLKALTSSKTELEQKTKTYEDLVSSLKDEINSGKVTISEMKDRLTVNLIDKILFDSGSTVIKVEGQEALKKIASVLKDVKDKRIQVEGHTDNVKLSPSLTKKFPTNWELSTARATVVVRYLAELGLAETRLSAAGNSMFAPVASNDTPEGRAQNRRIEIVLLPLLPVKPMAPQPQASPVVTPAPVR